MEYLEGETLAEALGDEGRCRSTRRCASPFRSPMRSTRRIAQGIVHRDLKPGNIMLTAAGAKLLDFGLAKTRPAAIGGTRSRRRRRSARPLTVVGTVLGTPQLHGARASGREATRTRAAISSPSAPSSTRWRRGSERSRGTARRALMAAILEREPPPLRQLQPLAPPLLDHVVTRCLAKDPEERWQNAGDVMRELTWIAGAGRKRACPRLAMRAGRGVSVPSGCVRWRRLLPSRRSRAWPLDVRPRSCQNSISTSRPRRRTTRGRSRFRPTGGRSCSLRTRTLAHSCGCARSIPRVSQLLKGTDNGQFPFWSPDSQSIGFAASGQLKRLDLEGGVVRKLANAPLFLGGTWNIGRPHPVRSEHELLCVPGVRHRRGRAGRDSRSAWAAPSLSEDASRTAATFSTT